MKKLLFLLLLTQFFVTPFLAHSQNNKYHLGSARVLAGNIYTLACFVSDNNNEWTRQEKFKIYQKLYNAQDWLKNQALKNEITLNFEGGNFGFDKDIKLDYIDYGTGSGREDINVLTTVFKKIGYTSNLNYYNWVLNNTNSQNTYVAIFVKGQGRSYSVAYTSELMDREKYFIECAVLYHQYYGGLGLYEATIAHEILHLFGAWDLYETFQQTRENDELAKKMFPDTIMRRITLNINDLYVDEVTAWLVGWNNIEKDWYEGFKPFR